MILDRDLVPARKKKTSWGKILGGSLPGLVAAFGIAKLVHSTWIFPVVISTPSMAPLYPEDSTVYVNRWFQEEEIQAGAVVWIAHPHNEKYHMLRRVAGLPGDTIEIRNGILYRNGKRALLKDFKNTASAAERVPALYTTRDNMPPLHIPDRHIFVIADASSISIDSRDFGPAPYEKITGIIQ